MTDNLPPPINNDRQARQWAMFCHLSALVGLLGNGIGFLIAPLIIWLIKKEDYPFVNEQGKEAVNFQITMLLAALVCIPLLFVVVGFVLLIAIGVLATVFPIIAAIKASDGIHYRYPLSIRFIN